MFLLLQATKDTTPRYGRFACSNGNPHGYPVPKVMRRRGCMICSFIIIIVQGLNIGDENQREVRTLRNASAIVIDLVVM